MMTISILVRPRLYIDRCSSFCKYYCCRVLPLIALRWHPSNVEEASEQNGPSVMPFLLGLHKYRIRQNISWKIQTYNIVHINDNGFSEIKEVRKRSDTYLSEWGFTVWVILVVYVVARIRVTFMFQVSANITIIYPYLSGKTSHRLVAVMSLDFAWHTEQIAVEQPLNVLFNTI